MDKLLQNIPPFVGALLAFLGVFGWSHSNIQKKIDHLNHDVTHRVTYETLRLYLQDKLEPLYVELKALNTRLESLSRQYEALSQKLDQTYKIICHHGSQIE